MIIAPPRLMRYFDWLSLALVVAIGSLGLLFVFSATYTPIKPFSLFFKKQLIGLSLGLCIYSACVLIDYRSLIRWGYFAYLGLIALLAFTLVKGSIGMGAQRWVNLFFFKMQPSELTKLLFPAFVAHYVHTHEGEMRTMQDFAPLIATLCISFILILKQPDLGTAVVVACSGLVMLRFAGLPRHFFICSAILLAMTAPAVWHYVLKPYQKKRIAVFLGYGTSHAERYQIEQSVIAIGSGGITGKGFLRGTQNILNFLPESRTDFIFAVLCEEWGFIGALTILILYFLLFMRSCFLITLITSLHARLLAIGLLIHIILSAMINIAMVTGLLPIVGIPLPLMSYGISNLWITMASLGWLQGIGMQQTARSSLTFTPRKGLFKGATGK